jgi:predicted PurR-regulated permease PerM
MSILLLEVSNAIVPNAMGIQNYVLQYGLLGVIAVVLAYIAFQQYQKLIERNDMLEDKIDRVQKEMNDLLIEERDRMMKLIEDNTKALNELQKTILNFMIGVK